MRAWRAGDARGALDRIAEYEDLYPGGHFAPEAILVKVDALQALGRSDEALTFLRYQSLAKLPRATELEVIRGELSAKAGRCEEAVADFDQALRHDPGERLGARALYARASCRARLGDEVGAETDLRLYLLRYPNGPHVVAVRRALAR
jgi:Flp pilus assembly protein TadD